MIKHLLAKCNVKPPFCRFNFVWKKQWIVTRCIYKFSTYTLKPHPIGLIKHAVRMTKCDGVDINAAIVWSVFFFQKKKINESTFGFWNECIYDCVYVVFFVCKPLAVALVDSFILSEFSDSANILLSFFIVASSAFVRIDSHICLLFFCFVFFVLWQIGFVN